MPYGCPLVRGNDRTWDVLVGVDLALFLDLCDRGGGIWIIQGAVRQRDLPKGRGSSDRAMEILRERYARGEINKEEF